MELVELIEEYLPAFDARFGAHISQEQRRAIKAMLRCRTPEAGEMIMQCPSCAAIRYLPHSCGHRSCPRCQHHETGTWLERQCDKLLPVPYFLVTFTVPASLRPLARAHSRAFFDAMFRASATALKTLGADQRFLGGEIAMTGVLHTHSRRLDFHPHIHYLIPGGAIDKANRFWKRKDWKFLFPEKALARLFRAKLLASCRRAQWAIPAARKPGDWVVNCTMAGTGAPALAYLSRYLYRGVIAEKNILRSEGGKVVFRYRDGRSGTWKIRRLPGEEFLRLVLQHVLPTSFRRTRDFGFLHGNARKTLRLIQLLLSAKVPIPVRRQRPPVQCGRCRTPMAIIAVCQRRERHATSPPVTH